MSQKLQEIINNIETIQRSFTEPTTVIVTDTEQILIQQRASFDTTNIPVGTPLSSLPHPLLHDSLRTGKVNRAEFESGNDFGIPFIVKWNPILENRRVVGLVITTTSTEKVDSLRSTAAQLATAFQEMNTTSEQLAIVSDSIANKIQFISNESESITKMVEDAYHVIKAVQEIANHSKILGLNAAIEAARAGEHGKGFSIVAEEIRRMADESKESAINIMKYLERVNQSIQSNNESIQEIAAMTEEHTASLEEFNSSLELIAASGEELLKSTKVF